MGQTVAASAQQFLAFDYGLKRTGVASGNRVTRSATPQGTIAAEGDDPGINPAMGLCRRSN